MNMEHVTGISILIFTFFSCFQATPVYLYEKEETKIDYLRHRVSCPPDSTFYAPTAVKAECFPAALECVRRELNGTATVECDDHFGYIDNTVEFLEKMIEKYQEQNHEPPKSRECECERWRMTPFSEFLDETESLLEKEQSNSGIFKVMAS